ncbi:RES family NAD+ phosphorylase [Erwinia tracheiphila]|uniref:RES domain-containing protein n=1 Tax=Erwinia tracheiphila TaxID=65700 RepID=A0A345CTM5_9GAMM|nr:RES family NAD+ phosphorylase [Erwinia tracheiphila]AXF76792.1 RES domain-containing protein [Erwinia tracheiphila]UIA84530.1 RES family NAD+ phosphorylase [Erwinia tracheiphila]UIA93123.1 RES family NAD+ phosphorylase [Erwinia tracheiphila]
MTKGPTKAKAVPKQHEYDEIRNTSQPHSGLLNITPYLLKKGTVLHRVHQEQYAADQFNPGLRGNARFSPIQNAEGEPVPTIYAGVTKDCAMMETVFHDVSFAPGVKTYDKSKLKGQVHSTLEVVEDLELLDLTNVSLRKLGVSRKALIDTEKDQYPNTRKWAEKLYQQSPAAQGLRWVSRQDDTAFAMMLFGDRIKPGSLCQTDESLSLVHHPATYDDVLDLAGRLDVLIVPGRD